MPLSRTEAGSEISVQQEVARLAGRSDVHAAFAWFRQHERELSNRQLEMVAIAAPPFGEAPRADWLRERFLELGLEDVHIDKVGNVLGRRPGADPSLPMLAITAHIDTVFPETARAKIGRDGAKLVGPGISDNAAGVIGMLAVAGALNAAGITTDAPLLFVGNVGEEGEGDLRGMRYLFAESPWGERIGATLVLDGAAVDNIVTQALGSRRFEVTVRGPGGHSWSDFGVPNPIVILARALAHLSHMPLPVDPKTSFNVGVISGGTSVNSIPESASARIDIRSASTEEIERVERALREAVEQAAAEAQPRRNNGKGNGGPIAYDIRLIGDRPAAELPADARMLQVLRAVDAQLGNRSHLRRASTDANIPLSLGREAVAIGAGGTGGGAHSLSEWYDPSGRDLGLKRVLLTVLALAGVAE